jgi:hypothetical protein
LPVLKSSDYINALTGEPIHVVEQEGKPYLDVSALLAHFPVALVIPKLISL